MFRKMAVRRGLSSLSVVCLLLACVGLLSACNTGIMSQPATVFAGDDVQPFLKRVATLPMSNVSLDVFIVGDYAYISSIGAAKDSPGVHILEILDVSEPVKPEKVGEIRMPGGLGMAFLAGIAKPGLHVAGNYAYVPSRTGLRVIDVKNPLNPEIVGSVDSPMQTGGIYAAGNFAYIMAKEALRIVDISDPRSPRIMGNLEPTIHDRQWEDGNIYVRSHYAYVATRSDGLYVISVEDPENPEIVGNVDYSGMAEAKNVHVVGDYAYVVGVQGTVRRDEAGRPRGGGRSGGLLQIIDISDPRSPEIVGSMEERRHRFQDVLISGSCAYVTSDGGLQVIDVSQPQNPAALGNADIRMFTGGEVGNSGIQFKGNYAYMTDGLGLQVVDISDPEQPEVAGSSPRFTAFGVHVVGNYAYVADMFNTLVVVDVSDRKNPRIVGNGNTPGASFTIHVKDNYAYAMAGDRDRSELQIIDVSKPSQPTVAGSIELQAVAGIHVMDDHAYVAGGMGMSVIDISVPGKPAIVGRADLPDTQSVYAIDDHAYLAAGQDGLQVVDILDPKSPKTVGSLRMSDAARGICVVGDYAYTTARRDGLQIIDVSDPQAPKIVRSFGTRQSAKCVHVSGKLAYVGEKASIEVIDISNPRRPRVVGSEWSSGYVSDVYAADGYVYVAGFYALEILQIEELSLAGALKNEDVSVRRRAVEILKESGDKEAVKLLIGALEDEDRLVRGVAIWALGQIGDARGVESLIEILSDKDEEHRGGTVYALAKIGDKRAVPHLERTAREDEDEGVRNSARMAVLEIKRDLDSLIAILNDQDLRVRQRAIGSLGRIGDGRAIEPLIKLLSDEEIGIRRSAAWALGEMGDERAIPHLERATDRSSRSHYADGAEEALAKLRQRLKEEKNIR